MYLEQVLVQLKRARLVKSYRGSHGGYALARDATKITVLDVLTCLEGPIEIGAVNYKDEILANLLESCKKQIRDSLKLSLADLIWRKRQATMKITYEI